MSKTKQVSLCLCCEKVDFKCACTGVEAPPHCRGVVFSFYKKNSTYDELYNGHFVGQK